MEKDRPEEFAKASQQPAGDFLILAGKADLPENSKFLLEPSAEVCS
ncbi:MAG: hypothetical protein IT558_03290 [Alphaproteobacteria bacterium]|nr:hypothetical protein [Alphaproteobacteria bacterium]